MPNLKKIVAPALVVAIGLGAATPVLAHDNHRDHWQDARQSGARHGSIRAEINDLRRDIDRAAARRTISQHEAAGLRRETTEVQRLYASYSRNGLSSREARVIRAKVDRIQFALYNERHDRDRRRG